MVTFTEEIFNVKLHFLCSVITGHGDTWFVVNKNALASFQVSFFVNVQWESRFWQTLFCGNFIDIILVLLFPWFHAAVIPLKLSYVWKITTRKSLPTNSLKIAFVIIIYYYFEVFVNMSVLWNNLFVYFKKQNKLTLLYLHAQRK